jgi:hypothetical protein
MKIVGVAVLSLFVVLLLVQIVSFLGDRKGMLEKISEVDAKLEKARADARTLKDDFDYFSNPANLEKELRSRFNYREAGEKLIIIVPQKDLSSATQSQ